MPPKVKTTEESEQKAILKRAEELIAEGMRGRKNSNVLRRAQKFDDYNWGDHPVKDDFGGKGKAYNKFSEIVENRVAHLTDNRPKWVFDPQEEGDLKTARALKQILSDYLWDKIEWDDKGEDAVLEAAGAGSCHIKAGFNVNDGWPVFTVVPCEAVIVDPLARKHKQLRYLGHFIAKSPSYVLEEYGVKVSPEMDFKRQSSGSNYDKPVLSYQQTSGNYTAPNVWQMLREGTQRTNGIFSDVLGQAIICELYMDDPTTEAIPFDMQETSEEHLMLAVLQEQLPRAYENHPKHLREHRAFLETLDPNIDADVIKLLTAHMAKHENFPQSTKRKKYPYGRMVTVCQGKLLRDEPYKLAEDIKVDWKDTWIKFDYTKSRNYYWGKPLAHDLFDPQDDFNYQQNAITQNIKLLLNGVRKWRRGRFKREQLERVTNLIGKNVLVDDPADLTVDFGKELPASHFNNLVSIAGFMDRQAGNTDVLSGQLPKGSPAGVTVDQLLQTGTARIRLALRHYIFALECMARIAIQIMIEYVDPGEEFEILGDNGEIERMEWRQLREQLRGSKALKNIRVNVRSISSTTRQQDQELIIKLGESGIVDPLTVLEMLDLPNKNEIIKRANIINQLKAKVEQDAQTMDAMQKQINTFVNRAQKEEGEGNVGLPTSR